VLLASVCRIIDAIKESRRIFQRMNSYAIYRIAETCACCSYDAAILVLTSTRDRGDDRHDRVLNDGAILHRV